MLRLCSYLSRFLKFIQVSILFTLHFYWLQYREQGWNCSRFEFYSYDIIEGTVSNQ